MIVIGKKTLIFLSVGFVSFVFLMIGIFNITQSVFWEENTSVVIVDAGHGEPDGGAVGVNGTLEKDINLKIAQKLEEVLEGKGIRVIMTRTGDSSLFETRDASIREKKT